MKWFNSFVFLLKRIYPKRIWSVSTNEKVLYLTFDDGPIPEVTPWVLKTLNQYQAKATFFCIGENVEKNRNVFNTVIAEGHRVGNHTYNHVNGYKTSTKAYLENVLAFEKLGVSTNLFRPPYGKCKTSQAKPLQKKRYNIVMWDVISEDYDKNISEEQCYQTVIDQAKKGSIVIFHDSLKAEKNLRYALPKVLKYFSEKGYVFNTLPADVAALKQ